jgi:hypothetical protein
MTHSKEVNLQLSKYILNFDLLLNFHTKIILSCRIDHLNFKNGETICSIRIIHATHGTVAYIY